MLDNFTIFPFFSLIQFSGNYANRKVCVQTNQQVNKKLTKNVELKEKLFIPLAASLGLIGEDPVNRKAVHFTSFDVGADTFECVGKLGTMNLLRSCLEHLSALADVLHEGITYAPLVRLRQYNFPSVFYSTLKDISIAKSGNLQPKNRKHLAAKSH